MWEDRMASNEYPRLLINPEKRKARHDGGPIMCAVSGCGVKIETKYHKRFRLCPEHVKSPVLLCGSKPMRFCQQCNKLQPRDEFSGIQRNCRWSLIKRQKTGTKGAKATDKKGKDAYHTSDQDSSTVGSDRDMPSFADRKAPFGTGSVFGGQVEEAGQCLSSNVQRSSSREGKDLDSAKIDTGDGENGSNTAMAKNARLVRNGPDPVFIRCDSNSSRNGSADVDMAHLLSDEPDPVSDPFFGAEPASVVSPETWGITDDDLPEHLHVQCKCGACEDCLSRQEVTSSTGNCWVCEPVSRPTAEEPKLACVSQTHMDPNFWGASVAYDSADHVAECFPVQKPTYTDAEGHSVCAAPLQHDQIYPISSNVPAQHPGPQEWHDPVPSPLSRDSVCQYRNQQCSSISHPHLAAQTSTLHSVPDPAGSNLNFASPRTGTAQFGQLPRNCSPLQTGPCLRYRHTPVDVAPDFCQTQGPLYSLPVAMEEPRMMLGSEAFRVQQRIECPASTLSSSHLQMIQQASTPSLSRDPFAFAQGASRQTPPQRPVDLLRFHRRTLKLPNANHSPGINVLEKLAPIVANGNLTAQSRVVVGCVRVLVTVATTETGGGRNVGISPAVDSPIEGFGKSSGYFDCRGWPSNDEVEEGQLQNEKSILGRMAGHLPMPASPSAQNLAKATCWIQTEHQLTQVVDGFCYDQQDVADALSNFSILSMRPACFLASHDTDVKILGRGLGDPARVLCSFNEETRVLNLSLTRIRVRSGGEVEIINSKNMEQAGLVSTSEALALVSMAGDKVEVGDVLEIWSGRVRAFHGVGVAYMEAEKKHLLTDPMPVFVVRDERALADYAKLEQEVEEGRMSAVELQQTREDVGHVLCHLAIDEIVAETERADDRIDFAVHPFNDQANPEYRELMVNLASWHLGNFCRRGLTGLMRAMLPATLLSGADFAAVAESAFSDGFTLLHYAVMSGKLDTIQAVMDLGTQYCHTWRWDIKGPMGITPLHMLAVSDNGSSMLKYATTVQPDVTTLWFDLAASNGETPEKFAERAGNSDLNDAARGHREPSLEPLKRGSAGADMPGYVQDWLPLLPGPPWGALRFSDPKLENKFKDYRGRKWSHNLLPDL